MGDQSFVSQATRARVRGAITPIALGAGKLGLTPNALTVIGFLIAVAAAATASHGEGPLPTAKTRALA